MSDPDKMAAVLAVMNSLGIDPQDLRETLEGTDGIANSQAPTLAAFIDTVMRTMSDGTRRGYATHLNRLRDGVERQCSCTCNECLDRFAAEGKCSCTCTACADAMAFEPMGELALVRANFRRTTLEPLVTIAQRMSTKKAMLENRSRGKRDLPPKHVHGQGGQEMCVSALRALFGRAVDDELLATNPAAKLDKGMRSETVRRALSVDEVEQLFDEVANGGDDPALDLALVWVLFETAARRDGVLNLTVGSIRIDAQMITLHEKQNRERSQPISTELIDYLIALAIARGGDRCRPGHESFDPSAPLLYYSDSTPADPHPLSRKRFATLFDRIQRRFDWAAETQFTAHALRHTTARLVERNFNNQVARHYLGHGARTTTDSYTKASSAEVAEAFSAVTGFAHPDAESR